MGMEVKKGNHVPYHGFLLNMSEWRKYEKMQELMPQLINSFEKMSREEKYNGIRRSNEL